jgi:cytochrome c oxidase subunit 3
MAERLTVETPYPSIDRQRSAGRLGMLVFLANEILLFGGVFAGALMLRLQHPQEYLAASKEMHVWLGGVNTAVLLTSSLLVAVTVQAVRAERARLAAWLLAGAIVLGVCFLGIKFAEYYLEYRDGVVPRLSDANLHGGPHELFMNLYFAATGLHALHMTAGLILLTSLIWPLARARSDPTAGVVHNVALYWHLVDIVWVFLYPTLYLAR